MRETDNTNVHDLNDPTEIRSDGSEARPGRLKVLGNSTDPRKGVQVVGLLTLAVGLSALVGWTFNLSLGRLISGGVSMKPWTAVAFACCGTALVTISRYPNVRWVGIGLSGIVVLIGALSILEYALARNLISEALFSQAVSDEDTPIPGRMALVTALNMGLIGTALILFSAGRSQLRYRTAKWILVCVAALALISVAGHIYGADILHTTFAFSTISFHTALTFVVFSIGALFVYPAVGASAVFLSDTEAGRVARLVIPVAVVAPIVLGWLRLQGELMGLYDTRFGLAIFATGTVLVITAVLWRTSVNLENAERRRLAVVDELQWSESKFRAIASALAERMWEMSAPKLEGVNAPAWWTEVSGQTDKDVKNFGWLKVVHPDDRDDLLKLLAEAFASQNRWQVTFRLLSKSGNYRYFDLVGVPIFENDGTFKQWIGTANDVTAEKEALNHIIALNKDLERNLHELELANADLASFSYSVSHDLRAPLRAIDGFSLALLEDYYAKLDVEGRNYLERIRTASRRMSEMVDALLVLSRVTRSELTRSEVDLSAMASEVVESLRAAAPDRKAVVQIQPDIVAHADAKMMLVVMQNLLNNAWKFTSKREVAEIQFGKIEIDGITNYYLRDNGAGFDMQYASKLFGPFQRLHNPADFEGSGIGLTTVQRIIRRHGGRITAEGEINKGANFYFSL